MHIHFTLEHTPEFEASGSVEVGWFLVEARVSPRDIAFIHTGLPALVKLTAYDYAIYGELSGKVTVISPDTLRDEVKQDQVYIQTDSDHLANKEGQKFSITSGMITTVDIRTGEKTILDYLFNGNISFLKYEKYFLLRLFFIIIN